MNVNTEIRISRLNYEWVHLVDYLKHYDDSLWDSLYNTIREKLSDLLGDTQVSIGSEYTVFNDCIRQAPDLYGELMNSYEKIITNYRMVLGLCLMLPFSEISKLMTNYNGKVIDEINKFFNQINYDIANDGYMNDSGIYVNGVKYYGYVVSVHNLPLLDVMDVMVSGVNSEQFMSDVKEYIHAIVLYELIGNLIDDADSK